MKTNTQRGIKKCLNSVKGMCKKESFTYEKDCNGLKHRLDCPLNERKEPFPFHGNHIPSVFEASQNTKKQGDKK